MVRSFLLLLFLFLLPRQENSEMSHRLLEQNALPPGISRTAFGKTGDDAAVDLYTLENSKGMLVRIMTYGATVTEIRVPDRDGRAGNVVLGFDNLAQYLAGCPYFGATVGRVANRIARGRFTLDGAEYQLATNNGPNHLHGGLKGFDKVLWTATPLAGAPEPLVRFAYRSPDGEENYPGNLSCTVTFTLTDDNGLRIEYSASTDKATPVNMTNHSYFNLGGPGTRTILGHMLMIEADRYTPIDETLIPTGELAPVKGTPMDFTRPAAIGSKFDKVQGGYDHNYVLNSGGSTVPVLAARVSEPRSGRVLEVLTTEPGLQFYSGNFLDGTLRGNGGVYPRNYGFSLEAQHFPDSVNHPAFPSTTLRPGQVYRQVTVYRFSADR